MGLTGLRRGVERKEARSSKHKLEEKLNFYAKVNDAVATLSAKKAISKKRRLRSRQRKLKSYDLSALKELLPDLDAPSQCSTAANLKLNCKSRQKIVQREGAQLRAVLKDPTFAIDPFSAIHQHLVRTQPPPPPGDREKPSAKSKNKRKKNKGKKTSSSTQSMDL
ncbi:hypothetical protein ACMD2_13215 [Ananas comosus]|uniref:Ribosome biogenesis protein slx9-like n=1 Tax=Ananas comosus TaxID=4615 RepID=A0A199UNM0_ANACO|nr:hypothetical protein ACMD2_13215 [Ananas comosus]